MKKAIILLVLGTISTSIPTWANDLVPVAEIAVTPDKTTFYNLEQVVFDADDSYVPNGYIIYTKWYIDGAYQTGGSYYKDMDICFALDGSADNGCYQLDPGQTQVTVTLEVQSNTGYWDSVDQTYTVQEHKGRKYFVMDHLGSVRATVNRDGNVLGYSDYYPFGLELRSNNTANPNDNYKYTSHEMDVEAGLDLIYAGARYMDPVIGRWQAIDPLAHMMHPNEYIYHGVSQYNYALNNPVNYYDPNGLWVFTIQYSARVQFLMGSINSSIGVAIDDQWNVGIFRTWGVGLGLGLFAGSGLEISIFPTATHISQIVGYGGTVAAYAGVGPVQGGLEVNASADAYFDRNGNFTSDSETYGFSVSPPIPGISPGVGMGATAEFGKTSMLELGNLTSSGVRNSIVSNLLYNGVPIGVAGSILNTLTSLYNASLDAGRSTYDFFNDLFENDEVKDGETRYEYVDGKWVPVADN